MPFPATMTSEQPLTNFSLPTSPEVVIPASQRSRIDSTSTAQRSIGTTPRLQPPCSTRPHNINPKRRNEGARQTIPTISTAPSAVYATKTMTYDATLKYIRMLTIENNRQKEQLEQLAGVSDLNARRTH